MKTLLKDLYDCFYTPPEFSEQKREVEECMLPIFQEAKEDFAKIVDFLKR